MLTFRCKSSCLGGTKVYSSVYVKPEPTIYILQKTSLGYLRIFMQKETMRGFYFAKHISLF